jgi:Ion channel
LFVVATTLVSLAVFVVAVQAVADADVGVEWAGYLIFPLAAIAPIAILARIARHPTVNLETILGSLSAYLLIGILFAGLYRGGQSLSAPFFQQAHDPSPVQFLYFSFVSLTTTGYGDFTPAHDSGRVLANFEQLIGQVFLVTIVAGLVASFGRTRSVNTREE